MDNDKTGGFGSGMSRAPLLTEEKKKELLEQSTHAKQRELLEELRQRDPFIY